MKRTLVLTVLVSIACSQASQAQVCIHRKAPKFLECLKSVDDKCKDLTTLVKPRARKWQSGYKFATADERVKFAQDYQEFLVSKGETGEASDFGGYKLISYEDRQAWAMQWWAKEDKNFVALSSLEEKANWVHDAMVDAGNTVHIACQTVAKMDNLKQPDGDVVTKDNVELQGVDDRKIEERRNK